MEVSERIKNFIIIILICIISISRADIFINQTGYHPTATKKLFTTNPADSFKIYNVLNQSIVYQDRLGLFISNDPATGLDLYVGDFSNFTNPGNYICKIAGSDSSYKFIIHDSVYVQIYKKSLKALYFQRCGFDLLGSTVGNYYHTRCHNLDGIFHVSTGSTGFRLSRGGWHDAGDYGKYIVNAGVTVGSLLMAYEYFPHSFNQDDLNIAESGNSIPDILDEIKYQLEWMLTMQALDGGVYHKLTPEQFAPFIMPQNDGETRYIYQISSTATGDFTAVMARAARIYQPIDSIFSNVCLNAAELSWNYLSAHPNIIPTGGFSNPSGTATGEYGDSDDRDERLWASVELYLTTGNLIYHNFFLTNYNQTGLINSAMSWRNVKAMAHLAYIFGHRNDINVNIQNDLTTSLNTFCLNLVIRSFSNGFNVTINPGEYTWGSNCTILNNALMLIMGYEKLQNVSFKETALDQMHYIIGNNAHRLSFVTGIGSSSPMFPHHRPSGSDGIPDPIPGLLVGGPDEYLSDPLLQANFNSSTPPALCYLDNQESYASNEIAINWNAPLVLVSGYFAGSVYSKINAEFNIHHTPQNFILQQNYPNPFNSRTKIEFLLLQTTRVRLEIFDVRGSFILEILNENFGPGIHQIFYSTDSLPSGIYWYKLSTETASESRKMILIK